MKAVTLIFSFLVISLNVFAQEPFRTNSTYQVGDIPGKLEVSPSGSAMYIIPIDLPPGRAGITPAMSIQYNSQQRASQLLGQGWSITGFSVISRTNPTLYYNGINGCVDFNDDELLLDGQHLVKIGTEEYRTELDMISKILLVDGIFGKYFKVYSKDGMISEYGNSIDSRQGSTNNSDNNPLAWHINRRSDRLGNTIIYNYEQSNSPDASVRPLEIKYTCDVNGTNADTKIIFQYSTIDSCLQQTHYYEKNGLPFINTNNGLLDKIQIFGYNGSVLITEYVVNYFQNKGVCKENFVKEIGLTKYVDGLPYSVKPTTFSWDFYQPNYTYSLGESDYIKSMSSFRSLGLDIYGDHTDELAVYCSRISDPLNWNEPPVKLISFYGTSFNDLMISGNLVDMRAIDCNIDGDDELLVVDSDGLKIYDFNPINLMTELVYSNPTGGIISTGDLSGDGITDILFSFNSMLHVLVGTQLTNGTFSFEQSHYTLPLSINQSLRTVGDMNGDGVAEVLCKGETPNSFLIYSFVPDQGFILLSACTINPWPTPEKTDNVFYCDFNGDGKTDISFIQIEDDSTRTRWTCFSYGNNFMSPIKSHQEYDSEMAIADINNDGRADFFTTRFAYGKINLHIWYTQPDGISSVYSMSGLNWNNSFERITLALSRVSANGLMGFSILCSKKYLVDTFQPDTSLLNMLLPSYEVLSIITLGDFGTGNNIINSITTGFGTSTMIKYAPLGTTGQLTSAFPLTKPRFFEIIVDESYIIGDDSINWNHSKYQFDSPITHVQGKGFLGFKKSIIKSFQNKIIDEIEYEVIASNNKFFFLYPRMQKTWSLDNNGLKNNLLSEVGKEFLLKLPIPGMLNFFPIEIKRYIKSWENDSLHSYKGIAIDKIDFHSVDNYGNVGKQYTLMDEMETETDPTKRCSWEQTIETRFKPADYMKWIVSLVDNVINTTYHKPEETNIPDTYTTLKTYSYFYPYGDDAPLVEIIKTTPDNTSALAVWKTYSYDSFGNITNERLETDDNGDLKIRENGFSYSSFHNKYLSQRVVKAPRTGDQTHYYVYDSVTGYLLSSKNPNSGGTTNYQYNSFGGLMKTIHPDGTSIESITGWCEDLSDIIPPAKSLFYTSTFRNLNNSSDKWQKSFIFYDKYSRVIRTAVQSFNGTYIYSDTKYDSLGRKIQVSEPYFETDSASAFTTYKYDNLNRLCIEQQPSGKTIAIDYKGRVQKITLTSPKFETWKEKTVNILGNEQIVNDPAGSVYYHYDPANRVRSIYADDVPTFFEYDAMGNRTRIIDPDAGNTVSTYNAFGELLSQTDSRGSNYINTYDELGRIKTSYLMPDDILTKFEYNAGNENGFGKIKSIARTIKQSDEMKQLFYYDELGRLEGKFDYFEEKYYRHINEYDNHTGMLKTHTYPSFYQISYDYNKYGYLKRIFDQGNKKSIWSASESNARGQITESILGNGLIENVVYDKFGYPGVKNVLDSTKTFEIISQLFTFDSVSGNLISKEERFKNSVLKEQYTYDPLLNNRLTSWEVLNSAQQFSIRYLDNGNIHYKSDVNQMGIVSDEGVPEQGQYSYSENAGPHAVTSVTHPTPHYLEAASGQSIAYTGFNKVSSIIQATHEGFSKLNIEYGPDNQRIKSVLLKIIDGREINLKTKYFFGDFEVETDHETGKTRQLHYLYSPTGLFSILDIEPVTFARTPYYIHTDYQGTYSLITDQSGVPVERLSFDPWGQRRNAETWSYENVPSRFLFDRGYTGHEHLDRFDLINMNGRVFDPKLARFLSPDPVLQDAGNLQAHNRYSYCLNNPLKYIDPTGYFFDDPRSGKPLGEPGTSYGCIWEDELATGNTLLKGHWSNAYRSEFGNFMLMTSSAFINTYGAKKYNELYSQVANVTKTEEADPKVINPGNTMNGDFLRELLSFGFTVTFIPEYGAFIYGVGDPGVISVSGNGGIVTENRHGDVTSDAFSSGEGEAHATEGTDWEGVVNSTIGLIGGVAEMAIGGVSEYFSGGISSTASVPLMVDGFARTVANTQRLFMYFNGNTKLANAYPTSLGSLAGKGVDMALGVSVNKVGFGQAIGGWGNDLTSFILTGGNGESLRILEKSPSLETGLKYGYSLFSYPYSMYSNKPSK